MGYAYLPKIIAFAERASSWKLHLQVLSKMLNLQTAHANYLRCIHLYLQEIRNLQERETSLKLIHDFLTGLSVKS